MQHQVKLIHWRKLGSAIYLEETMRRKSFEDNISTLIKSAVMYHTLYNTKLGLDRLLNRWWLLVWEMAQVEEYHLRRKAEKYSSANFQFHRELLFLYTSLPGQHYYHPSCSGCLRAQSVLIASPTGISVPPLK